ncbi:kinase-like domain-containing protein [Gigaspora rosea]|uniref:Kinase-like domain-containing protein n=1 Tax=Gigaspora rosea TaxID=44941 RepID=A0A397V706_9GLOM|nr:kinase-like domain-containing protein [Gigaspora rosea]
MNPSLFDNALKESKINICDYNDFTILDKIGESNSGYVEKALWKSHERIIALKSLKIEMDLNENIIREFVAELQTLQEISKEHHPHILHFYGIAKENNERYFLIFQHADSNLRNYLKENFDKLTWNDKIRMATEIAMGLIHLHEGIKRIIHQELHSMNILVHENKMLIADFSMPKWKGESTNTTSHGIPAYMDPRYLANHKYKIDEKSNVYSFGVILWEISSGRSPFKSLKGRDEITYQIFAGKRETPVEGTPEPYIQLYSRCWDDDPDKRPEIQEVLDDLRTIKKSGILDNLPVEQKINTKNLPKDYKSVSPISAHKNVKFLDQMESSEQIGINKSVLINDEHFKLISKWINKTPPKTGIISKSLAQIKSKVKQKHDFKLLIRGSQDGFLPANFHEKCDNKGPTLTVLKVKDENEILGGYSPFSWESPSDIKFYYTHKSFLFSLDIDKPENSTLSRAKQHESVTSSKDYGPYFRGDLSMSKNFKSDRDCRCYRWYYDKPIRKSTENFSVEEYEVFQVIKKE